MKHSVSCPTLESKEDITEEMDVDCPEEIDVDCLELDNSSQIQEWFCGLSSTIPVDSVDGDGEENNRLDNENVRLEGMGEIDKMEVSGPGEFGPFLQLAPDLIAVPIAVELELKVEGPPEEEMLARLAGYKAEKAAGEEAEAQQVANKAAAARLEAQMTELQAQHDALKAKLVVKKAVVKKELPSDATLLAEPPVRF